MNKGTTRAVLHLTCTRDGDANPSERLPTKHNGLFCGRTLNEWWAIQSWASKEITHSVMVGETPEHAGRLQDQLRPYDVIAISRPASMMHVSQDSGGYPTNWGYEWAKRTFGNFNYVICDFVVNPLRPPDFFDRLVLAFDEKFKGSPDAATPPFIMATAARTDHAYYLLDGDRLIPQYVSPIGNSRYWPTYEGISVSSISTAGVYEWGRVAFESGVSMLKPLPGPWLFETEPWQEVHIDTPDQWDEAEFWFKKKIGGIEAYESYRRTWHGSDG